MRLRGATLNALNTRYIPRGQYSHVNPDLLKPEERIPLLVQLINGLGADIVGLQEVEPLLLEALETTGRWQSLWSPKKGGELDGCLMLVRKDLFVESFTTHVYSDGSGHVVQMVVIDSTTFVNTHLQWAPADTPDHPGLMQARELLEQLGSECPAVIFTDANDRPGGPVRELFTSGLFADVCGLRPTAFVNGKEASLDLILVRGVGAQLENLPSPLYIPTYECPTDHVPVTAVLWLPSRPAG